MTDRSNADLSVIIASYNSEKTISACLESLYNQKTEKKIEIILIDSSSDNTLGIVKKKFPSVRIISFSERKYPGDARNHGISAARSDIIAFVDSDCTVEESWVDEVLNSHKKDYLTIGGAIENGNTSNPISWAYYFCEFNLWLPSTQKKEVFEIAGCALSMKRRAFELYGPFIEGTYSSDTAFFWKLYNNNHKTLFVPSIKVYHTAHYNLRTFLSHIFTHRRDFARVMIKEKRISNLHRASLIFLTPFSPPVLFLTILSRILKARSFQFEFLRLSPVVFAGLIARACGEFTGFLTNKNHKYNHKS